MKLCRVLGLLAATTLVVALSGCGHLNGWGQVGPSLKPQFGANVSVPLGSK